MSKEAVSGLTEKDLEDKRKQNLANQLNTETQQADDVVPDSEDQDATDNELSKFDNILLNTWGFKENEVNDKVRKVAKSWSNSQRMATEAKQEAQTHKKLVEQLDGVLDKHPTLRDSLQQAIQGTYNENPIKQEPQAGQPTTQGELDYDVNEDVLIQKGYLSSNDLEGLDEFGRQQRLLRAGAKYIREQEAESYTKQLQQARDNLRKQDEEASIKSYNENVIKTGFDNFVKSYGVNFAEMEDSVIQEIGNYVKYTLDPNDPRRIRSDAFEVVAKQVLSSKGLLPEMKKTETKNPVTGIEDSGTSFSKATRQQRKLSLTDELTKKAQERFYNRQNVKNKYKTA